MKSERFEITQGYNDLYIRDIQTNELLNLHNACRLLNEFNDQIEYYHKYMSHSESCIKQSKLDIKKRLKEAEEEAEEYNLDAMSYQTLYEQQLEKNKRLEKELKERLQGHENCDQLYHKLHDENSQLKKRIKELEIENEAQSDAIDGLQETLSHWRS